MTDFESMNYDEIISYFDKNGAKFDDGRINYKACLEAPVVNIFVMYNNELLLVKRSHNVMAYQGKWNSVSWFLDEKVSLEKKVHEELREELNIKPDIIQDMKVGKILILNDESIERKRIIFPVLITLSKQPDITLDKEHTEYLWINPAMMKSFDIIPRLEEVYDCVKEG